MQIDLWYFAARERYNAANPKEAPYAQGIPLHEKYPELGPAFELTINKLYF